MAKGKFGEPETWLDCQKVLKRHKISDAWDTVRAIVKLENELAIYKDALESIDDPEAWVERAKKALERFDNAAFDVPLNVTPNNLDGLIDRLRQENMPDPITEQPAPERWVCIDVLTKETFPCVDRTCALGNPETCGHSKAVKG